MIDINSRVKLGIKNRKQQKNNVQQAFERNRHQKRANRAFKAQTGESSKHLKSK